MKRILFIICLLLSATGYSKEKRLALIIGNSAYATAPGNTASDGGGNNGLYTSALVKTIPKSGLSIEEVFKQVRVMVVDQSNGTQTPWESTSLTGDFYFRSSADYHTPKTALKEVAMVESIAEVGSYNAGGKLKAVDSTYWHEINEGADNSSGFTALPIGGQSAWLIIVPGTEAVFWSSTEFGSKKGYTYGLNSHSSDIHTSTTRKKMYISVRCIKDP